MPLLTLRDTYFDPGIRILWCWNMLATDGPWDYRVRSSPYWRFYWNDREGSRVTLEGAAYELTPDCFTVIPPNTDFICEREGEPEHFYIHFTTRPPLDRFPPMVIQEKITPRLRKQVREAIGETRKPPPCSMRLAILAQSLAGHALTTIPLKALNLPAWDERILDAIHFMDENLQRSLRNEDLAERAGMSTNAFARLFREQTGETIQHHLAALRIDEACRQLQYSDVSIERIAHATGFCDRYHLSRTFKRHRGEGPASYRKKVG
ncbi:MAG: helix-turn-helix domain-containing protein [Planctomycetota bacterium]|jgi:AraC-like DNA-binding protein